MLPQVSCRLKRPAFRYLEEVLNESNSWQRFCLKSTFLNRTALSRLGHWWLIFNHYKFTHFCFLSNSYCVNLLLYPVRKDSSLAFLKSQSFSLVINCCFLGATYTHTLDHIHTNGLVTFISKLSLNVKYLIYVTTQSTGAFKILPNHSKGLQ